MEATSPPPRVSTLRESGARATWGTAPCRRARFRTWGRRGINGLASRLMYIMRRGRQFPASAQGLVDGDEAGGRVGARLRKTVLRFQLCALRVEHVEEVHQSPLVASTRDARGRSARFGSLRRVAETVAGAGVSDEGVLGVLEGAQHSLLVGGEGDVGPGTAALYLCFDAAQIEGRPRDPRSDHVAAGRAAAERAPRHCRVAEAAGECHLREEITDRNADECGRGGKLTFCDPDVRPAPQQPGRIADRGDLRQVGQLALW